jgi:hypothetical protein
MKNKRYSLGFYLSYSIIAILIFAIAGWIISIINSYTSVSDSLTSDYYRSERSRIIKENKTYTVTKLNYEKDRALSIDFDTYYVTMKDDNGNVQTINVDSTTYYSLNVGDSVNYKGQPVSSSEE